MSAGPYARSDFNGYFAAVYLRQFLGVFNPADRRPDYRDPEIVQTILADARRLLTQPSPDGPSPIPRRLFLLWQQGWDQAPALVRATAQSWSEHNRNWEITLVDDKTLADYAPAANDIDASGGGRTARANVARLALLARHGGVWADATLLCARPLDEWLPRLSQSGLFMFAAPRAYRQSEIWFMASAPQSPVLAAWRDMVADYWRLFRRPHHYYWMEYLFGLLIARNADAARVWGETPRVRSDAAEIVAANAFDPDAVPILDQVVSARIPVHKLSHKWRHKGSLAGTPLGALTGLDHI